MKSMKKSHRATAQPIGRAHPPVVQRIGAAGAGAAIGGGSGTA